MRTYEIPASIGGGEQHNVGTTERGQDDQAKRGTTVLRVLAKRLPTTLTLTARNTRGSISEPLPDKYAEAPDVKAALDAKRLERRDVPVTSSSSSPSSAPPAPSTDDPQPADGE